MNRRPMIATQPCRRCGRLVASLTRPIHGTEATRQKWAGICERCTTFEERAQLQADLQEDIARRLGVPLVREELARMSVEQRRAWLDAHPPTEESR